MTSESAAKADSRQTLGALLYARPSNTPSEASWVGLVTAIASGDAVALGELFDRAHRLVFTLLFRMTANRETAEELTLDVFYDAWRRAPDYDPEKGTVLGWLMNQARSRGIDRLRYEARKKRQPGDMHEEQEGAAHPEDVVDLAKKGAALREALTTLSAVEREAIETTFFGGLTHAEAAARLNQPLGTVKTRIRSGLHKLRGALGAEVGNP